MSSASTLCIEVGSSSRASSSNYCVEPMIGVGKTPEALPIPISRCGCARHFETSV